MKFLGNIFLAVCGVISGFCIHEAIEDETPLAKCAHPTELQTIQKHERYEMFIDSMEKAKKKDVERLTDSLIKYSIK